MWLDNPRRTNLDENIQQEPSLPRVSNIMKMSKNIFSVFKGDNLAKNACGNVISQALSACLAKSQFEGCATQQTLRFCAMVFLGGHLFKIHWICCHRGGDSEDSGGGGGETKNQQQHFSNLGDTKAVH
jgi:hypothetical protein